MPDRGNDAITAGHDREIAALKQRNLELSNELERQAGLRRMAERGHYNAIEELKVMQEELQKAHAELQRAYDVVAGN